MDSIETSRLLLRPFRGKDIEFLDRLHSDRDVVRYLTGRTRSHEENVALLGAIMEWHATEGIGPYLVERKADGVPAGRCGFSYFYGIRQDDGLAHFTWGPQYDGPEGPGKLTKRELGYTFAKQFWGQGYASEAARAVRDHGFGMLRFPEICSLIMKENAPSVAVAGRLGFSYAGDLVVHDRPAGEYRMTREEWLKNKSGPQDAPATPVAGGAA